MKKFKPQDFQKDLLRWYRKYQRSLPWRAKNPKAANPYHVWLSEIMLQQTVVNAVIPYFLRFTTTWPRIEDLASAKDEDVMNAWAGLGYYARARNLLACARQVVAEHGGLFPSDELGLLKLKGIGPYTAAAIRAIAFNKPSVVVDGNIERVAARVFRVDDYLPASKPSIKRAAAQLFEDDAHPAEMAQALMDLGAMVCTPKSPKCDLCPVRGYCAVAGHKDASNYPLKAPKIERPIRRGDAYIFYTRANEIWVERRDERRMLGGMNGFPTTAWDKRSHAFDYGDAYKDGAVKIGNCKHIFSHFELHLDVYARAVTKREIASFQKKGEFIAVDDIMNAGLPTVFRKVFKVYSR